MTIPPSPPATKEDIAMLMDSIGKLYIANKEWKDEIIDSLDARIEKKINASEKRMKFYFDFQLETKFCDLRDSMNDKFSLVYDRFDRLERHVGYTRA